MVRTAAAFLAVLAILTGVFCGGRTGPQQPAARAAFPSVACSTLTEAELTRLVRALPAFNGALKAAKWTFSPTEPGEGLAGSLTTLIEHMHVAGVRESLEAVGSDWDAVRATLYKVFAASAALNVAGVPPDRVEQMKQDKTDAGRRMYRGYVAVKEACSALPAANLELVKSRHQELQPLGTLGQ